MGSLKLTPETDSWLALTKKEWIEELRELGIVVDTFNFRTMWGEEGGPWYVGQTRLDCKTLTHQNQSKNIGQKTNNSKKIKAASLMKQVKPTTIAASKEKQKQKQPRRT